MADLSYDPNLFNQISTSGLLIATTTFVHGVFIAAAAAIFRATRAHVQGITRFLRDTFVLVLMSLIMMAAHAIEIWMWARTLIYIDAFDGLEPALYFAAVSYTTLGFGDILLETPWRLLSGAAAANGLLLFGLSAAFMVETSVKLRLGGEAKTS
ncbi:MAG: potassium channel family protein [Pseudomonadota bacterium]